MSLCLPSGCSPEIHGAEPRTLYSFAAFPNRLQNTLTARGIAFEPVVYPPYDTRGELIVAGESPGQRVPRRDSS